MSRHVPYLIASAAFAIGVCGCGSNSSAAHEQRQTPLEQKLSRHVPGAVYMPTRPHIPTGCQLLRLGHGMGGPHGAYWLIRPRAPDITGMRSGGAIALRWSLPSSPAQCRPAGVRVTVRDARDEFAGGTGARPVPISTRTGRFTISLIPPLAPPFKVLAESVTASGMASSDATLTVR